VNYRERFYWWATTTTITERIGFEEGRNCLEYFKSVGRIPLKSSERLLCYAEIDKWFIREGWLFIGSDLEKVLLSRSKLGRKLISLRRMVFPIIKMRERAHAPR